MRSRNPVVPRALSSSALVIATFATMVFAGCAVDENSPATTAIAALSETSFKCSVEPILVRDCSFGACHGIEGRPLRVYGIGRLRQGNPATLEARTAPLTATERHANFLAAEAFTFGDTTPDDSLLLRKVLPTASGGFGHTGGAIFTGTTDARAVAIRAWLAGGTTCPGT